MKIKKGDAVIVLSGKDKGKKGTILRTLPTTNQVVIDGVNVVSKHQKNKRTRAQGQIITLSMPLPVANVALLEGGKAVRVGYVFEGEGSDRKKVRVARPSGKKI
jgi:large subunit ribosomal protein L24